MLEETWRPIPGYSNILVSDFGRIKKPNGIASLSDDGKGYKYINAKYRGKWKPTSVHRLVMLAFVGKCPRNKEVNHIDHNPSNNRLENLEYITPLRNMQQAFKKKYQGHSQSRWRRGCTIHFRIPCELKAFLTVEAKNRKTSLSDFIVSILRGSS